MPEWSNGALGAEKEIVRLRPERARPLSEEEQGAAFSRVFTELALKLGEPVMFEQMPFLRATPGRLELPRDETIRRLEQHRAWFARG
jgi:hypothetical protein